MRQSKPRGIVRPLLFLLAGPLVWAWHFSLLYGAVGFGGAFGFTPASVGNFTGVVTLAATAALLGLLWRAKTGSVSADRVGSPGLHEMARTAAALSLWAVLLQALVLFLVPF